MSIDFIPKPLIHPKCHPDEFPTAYLIRLAELNKYPSARWLVKSAAPLTGVRSARYFHELLLLAPWSGYQKGQNGCLEKLHNRYFDMRHMRFCPLCMNDSLYIRTAWQYKTSYVCGLHGVWLRNSCTKCKSRIAVDSPTLIYCECGHRILDQDLLKACPAMHSFQAFIAGELILDDVFTGDLKGRLDFVLFFIRWLRFKGYEQALGDCEYSREALSAVAEALFGGDYGMYNFLTRLKKINEGYLTRFRNQFYQRYPNESFTKYRALIEKYINKNWEYPLTKRNKNLRSDTLTEHPWVPLSIACQKYGVSKVELQKSIITGDIRYKKKNTKKRSFTYVYIPDIHNHLAKIKNIITLQEARVVIGLNKSHFLELAKGNFFKKSMSPSETGFGSWCFSLEEMYAIRKKLEVTYPVSKSDTWSFSEIMKYFSGQIDGFIFLLAKSILRKGLTIESRDKTKIGFASLRFSKDVFNTWFSAIKQSEKCISIPALAKALKVNQQFVYELASHGVVKCSFSKETQKAFVSREDLSDFLDKYVFLSKLSKSSKLSSRTLISFFEYRGIKAIDEYFEKPLRQKIYLKEDLKNISIIAEYLTEKFSLQMTSDIDV